MTVPPPSVEPASAAPLAQLPREHELSSADSPHKSGAAAPPQDAQRVPYRLSRAQRYGCLALLLGLFFFGSGEPVWRNPFDVDWAVWLSYLPIPLLVLACLLYSRRVTAAAWFLNTLELTAVKFAITYGFAICMWAASDGPPPRAEWIPSMKLTATAPARPAPEPAPSVTPWPASKTGTLTGEVRSADGKPLAGALIYVSAGLEQVQAAVPPEVVRVAVGPDSAGQLLVAREYQALVARSADGRMHNLVASQHGHVLFNLPLLGTGAEQPLPPPAANEPVELRCIVHAPHGWQATLLVSGSPHQVMSDANGHFELSGVPALPLELAALHPQAGRAKQRLTLAAGGHQTLNLLVHPQPD